MMIARIWRFVNAYIVFMAVGLGALVLVALALGGKR